MANSVDIQKAMRGCHPNSRNNLKPFAKGLSGNPNGRPPKDVSLTSLLKKYLEEVPAIKVGDQANTKTWRELIVQAWLVGAYKGNSTLFIELINRLEGKIVQPFGGEGGGAIPVRVIYERADSREADRETG